MLATDASAEALALVGKRNARMNDVRLETAAVEWAEPDELVRRAPFDLVLARRRPLRAHQHGPLLSLATAPRAEAWLADPGWPAGSRSSTRRAAEGRSRRATATSS